MFKKVAQLSFKSMTPAIARFVCILVSAGFCAALASDQDDVNQPDKEMVFTSHVQQIHETIPRFWVNESLGPIRAKSKVRFRATLVNSGTEAIQFQRARVGCNCLRVFASSKVIPPGESFELVVDFQAPANSVNGKYNIQFAFETADGKPVLSVSLEGELEASIRLLAPATLLSNGSVSEWSIPLIVTAPVRRDRIKLELSKSLADVIARIEAAEIGLCVVLSIAESSLGQAGISGEITVSDPLAGASHTVPLTLLKQPTIRISPLVVYFYRSADDANRYEASVMVQALDARQDKLPRQSEVGPGGTTENRIESVSCGSEEYEIKVTGKKINEQIYRYQLVVEDAEGLLPASEFEIRWRVVSTKGVLETSGKGFLEK